MAYCVSSSNSSSFSPSIVCYRSTSWAEDWIKAPRLVPGSQILISMICLLTFVEHFSCRVWMCMHCMCWSAVWTVALWAPMIHLSYLNYFFCCGHRKWCDDGTCLSLTFDLNDLWTGFSGCVWDIMPTCVSELQNT